MAQQVKNPPAMQEIPETRVWSLGWEDPLEEGMAIHSSILAWRIPWTEEPGGLQSMGLQKVGHDWSNLAHTRMNMYRINQILSWCCTCMLSCFSHVWLFATPWTVPTDRRAWWATVHGIAKSWTWLSSWVVTKQSKIIAGKGLKVFDGQKHWVKWKEWDGKDYTLYDSICMNVHKR